jgi:hypothetical protein
MGRRSLPVSFSEAARYEAIADGDYGIRVCASIPGLDFSGMVFPDFYILRYPIFLFFIDIILT